jgi:hypothetical protein
MSIGYHSFSTEVVHTIPLFGDDRGVDKADIDFADTATALVSDANGSEEDEDVMLEDDEDDLTAVEDERIDEEGLDAVAGREVDSDEVEDDEELRESKPKSLSFHPDDEELLLELLTMEDLVAGLELNDDEDAVGLVVVEFEIGAENISSSQPPLLLVLLKFVLEL